jgi:D-beta-D-heptose 7-phosphate kinase/D-beta-D-heptose 1-phosphate adenosyltransferase
VTATSSLSIRAVESCFGVPRVLVVGDVMLDKYVWGEVERISPEAPVPVLRTLRQSQQPGGAANVAMNLAGLGARVTVMGFGGGDAEQRDLETLLERERVQHAIVACPGSPTTTKVRVLAGHQQLFRLDTDPAQVGMPEAAERLLKLALAELPRANVLVLSDYAKGVLNDRMCRSLIAEARRWQVPVVVDPKGSDFSRYHGATTICPNTKELAAVTGEASHQLKWMLAAGQKMVAALNLQYMLVTLGEKGIAILRADVAIRVPAAAQQVYDVSGAGDTVVAVVAVSTAAGLPVEIIAEMANVAAGIVIGKVGTVPVRQGELLGALAHRADAEPDDKVLALAELRSRVAGWRAQNLQIVFTNGCFDLLHAGHISLLEQARRMGDRLIVAINSDRSVRGLKGHRRPVVHQHDRAQVIAALAAVDAVIVFDEAAPLHLIEELRPDVLVKGGDYRQVDVVGAAEIRGWGGRLELIPLVEGRSTSALIERAAEPVALGTP